MSATCTAQEKRGETSLHRHSSASNAIAWPEYNTTRPNTKLGSEKDCVEVRSSATGELTASTTRARARIRSISILSPGCCRRASLGLRKSSNEATSIGAGTIIGGGFQARNQMWLKDLVLVGNLCCKRKLTEECCRGRP